MKHGLGLLSGDAHGRVRAERDWMALRSLSLAADFSRVVRPVTEKGASLCVAPESRTRNSGNIWDKSGRTFQPGFLVMQWTASRGGGGGWQTCPAEAWWGSGRAEESTIPKSSVKPDENDLGLPQFQDSMTLRFSIL